MKNVLFSKRSSHEETSPAPEFSHPETGARSHRGLLLLASILVLTSGCSRLLDQDEEERLNLVSSSCVTCHTSRTVMLAMLGDEIPNNDGGGGG
ncbi:MAG: hypothetical protein ISR91_01460 [Candidatus Delongbacteria bacterium]|nr:hypothetical protein [Candidatus Delongbacteria bacterium]